MPFANLLNMFRGKAGGAQMKPYKELKAEELAAWQGYDPTNQKSRHTQYANAAADQQQNPAMFGQGGDPNKDMGDIWKQLKGAGSAIGKGVGKFADDWQSNYEKQMRSQGLMEPEASKNPYPAPQRPAPTEEEALEVSQANNTPGEDDSDGDGIPNYVDKSPGAIEGTGKYGHGQSEDGQDIIHPASKNILGWDTDPITKGSIDDMGMGFAMGGMGGGGAGNLGKYWSQIKNWIK